MNGHQYEHKCAKKLKKHGFKKVKITRGSGDQGIDIIAYRKRKKYGIQCKYYSYPVGNHAVQEAFAGAKYYDCDVAAVMTNAAFTKSAKTLADRTEVLLWSDNEIPFSRSSFRVTRYIGLFAFLAGIFEWIAMLKTGNATYPFLQKAEILSLIAGGFLGIFEYGKWTLPFLSGIFYFIAGFINFLFPAMAKRTETYDTIFYLIVTLISFSRAGYLYKKKHKK
ncbi:restriction endonuclease [Lachnospiraceae bacterium 46-15]